MFAKSRFVSIDSNIPDWQIEDLSSLGCLGRKECRHQFVKLMLTFYTDKFITSYTDKSSKILHLTSITFFFQKCTTFLTFLWNVSSLYKSQICMGSFKSGICTGILYTIQILTSLYKSKICMGSYDLSVL